MTRRVLLYWSSGKESAWTPHVLRKDPHVEVIGLLATVRPAHGRRGMHAARQAILEAQAEVLGLPLYLIPWPCSNEMYAREMRRVIGSALERGVTHVALGAGFLQDIRAYRIQHLVGTGIERLFPNWREPSDWQHPAANAAAQREQRGRLTYRGRTAA